MSLLFTRTTDIGSRVAQCNSVVDVINLCAAEGLAIVSDVDGTCVNTNKVHVDCNFEACRQMEIGEFSFDQLYVIAPAICGGVAEQVARQMLEYSRSDITGSLKLPEGLSDDEFIQQYSRIKRGISRQWLEKFTAQAFPGVIEAFSHAVSLGVALALATNTKQSIAAPYLETTGISKLIPASSCVFSESAQRKKPFPDIFLKAAEVLNVSPSRIVVLEDTEVGVEAAAAAQVAACVVIPEVRLWRHNIKQALLAKGANLVLERW